MWQLFYEGKDKFFPVSGAYKIAVLAPLSGKNESIGTEIVDGIKQALLDLEIAGSTVEFEMIYKDTKSDAIEAAKATKEAIFDDKADIIYGPIFTEPVVAALGFADLTKTPVITPTANAEGLCDITDYLVCLNLPSYYQAEAVAKWSVNNLEAQKYAILYPAENKMEKFADEFERVIKENGKELVFKEKYYSDYKLKDLMENLRALEPEAVFCPMPQKDVIVVATQFRFYDIYAQLIGAYGWNSTKLQKYAKNEIKNSVFVDNFFIDESLEKTKNLLDRYKENFGRDITQISSLSYDGILLMEKALTSHPKDSREFLSNINNIKYFDGFER